MISAQNASNSLFADVAEPKETRIFGVPIGKLGLLSRLAMGGACGFLAFFATFFFAIIGVMIYDTATGTSLANLNIAYLYIAAPVGILAMLVSLTYLIGGWARRKFSGAE
jgi:hypothetical protein